LSGEERSRRENIGDENKEFRVSSYHGINSKKRSSRQYNHEYDSLSVANVSQGTSRSGKLVDNEHEMIESSVSSSSTSLSPRTAVSQSSVSATVAGLSHKKNDNVCVKSMDHDSTLCETNISQLFGFVNSYMPITVEIETPFKCFVPSYTPAIGGIDQFIKIPRPDNIQDYLGKVVIDEPALQQSDPALLQLHLRSTTKTTFRDNLIVKKVSPHDEPSFREELDRWIRDLRDVYRSAPKAVGFRPRHKMPSTDQLMQVWSGQLEKSLEEDSSGIRFLSENIHLNIYEYAKLLCVLLGIPVRSNSIIDSLFMAMSTLIMLEDNEYFS